MTYNSGVYAHNNTYRRFIYFSEPALAYAIKNNEIDTDDLVKVYDDIKDSTDQKERIDMVVKELMKRQKSKGVTSKIVCGCNGRLSSGFPCAKHVVESNECGASVDAFCHWKDKEVVS